MTPLFFILNKLLFSFGEMFVLSLKKMLFDVTVHAHFLYVIVLTADTCAEEQEHFHAEILVVGHLQPDQLTGDLQHLATLVIHVG